MKNKFLSLYAILTISALFAQEKLNTVSAPTSPASSVIGIQPSSVLSPKSYQALETAIYSNFTNPNNGIVIPNDFALEFTPYWTKNHGLSLQEYLYPEDIFNDQIIRNSSFSIASTQNFLLGDSTATNSLAFGYRTTLYFGNKNDRKAINEALNKLSDFESISSRIGAEAQSIAVNSKDIVTKDDFLKAIRGTVEEAIRKYYPNENAVPIIRAFFKEAESLPEYRDNHDNFLDIFNQIADKVLKADELYNQFKSQIRDRRGFVVDIAYATFLNFPTNDFEFSIVPRQSFWLTPTYRFKDNNWSFLKIIGVLRYDWYNTRYYQKYFPETQFYENSIDYGISVSGEFKNFSIQFEAAGRRSYSEIPAGTDVNGKELCTKESNSDFQYIGTFSYKLNDQILLTYSLGKRFELILNPNNTLVSLLTLNFGFGTPTRDDIIPATNGAKTEN